MVLVEDIKTGMHFGELHLKPFKYRIRQTVQNLRSYATFPMWKFLLTDAPIKKKEEGNPNS